MRIGIDCRLWEESGVGRYIRNLVENLDTLESDRKDNHQYFLFVKDKNSVHVSFKSDKFTLINTNVPWHSIQEQIFFPILLNKYNLDLMHFTYYSLPIFYNKPYIVTIHDLIIYHYPTGKASSLPKLLYFGKWLGYKEIIKKASIKSKKIITPLKSTKQDIINTLKVDPEKISVTTEGFSKMITKNSNIQKNPYGKYFLYVGNGYPHKNLSNLVEAFEILKRTRKDMQNIKLLLVGKNDFFYQKLKDNIKKKEYKNIVILHNVSDPDLFNMYKNAVSYVAVSFIEGFGLTPLEAMAFGVPIIVSDIPAFKEVCGDVGIYCDPNKPDDIALKLGYMYDLSKSERIKLSEKCKKRAQIFSWKSMAQETIKIYESCASL